MTEDLVNAVKNGTDVETHQKALLFLKDYVIYHFRNGEACQPSIHYSGLDAMETAAGWLEVGILM